MSSSDPLASNTINLDEARGGRTLAAAATLTNTRPDVVRDYVTRALLTSHELVGHMVSFQPIDFVDPATIQEVAKDRRVMGAFASNDEVAAMSDENRFILAQWVIARAGRAAVEQGPQRQEWALPADAFEAKEFHGEIAELLDKELYRYGLEVDEIQGKIEQPTKTLVGYLDEAVQFIGFHAKNVIDGIGHGIA